MLVLMGAVALVYLVATWKLFSKAGRPGWASLIPIYNTVVLCQICGRSGWLTLPLMIPGVNIIVSIILTVDLARVFGRGTGFMLGLIFLGPIFFPILAFGSSRYVGRQSGRSGMIAPALA
jgi:hypothetical protein